MLHKAEGVIEDNEVAFYWFSKAAERGLVEAQNYVGMMYRSGNGVEQNFEEAFIWLSIGANNGHPECQCNLGSMYLDGDGVHESITEGVHWLNLAFKQGCEYAREILDEDELWDYIYKIQQ